MKSLKYLNRYFYKYKFRFLFGVMFVAIANIFGAYPAQVIRHAINLVSEEISLYFLFNNFEIQSQLNVLFGYCLLVFASAVILLAVMRGLFLFFMRQTLIVMSRLIEYDLKNVIYQHYQKLSIAFYKRNKTGDMMARISEDVSRVRMYLGPGIMYGINLLTIFIVIIIIMLQVNLQLTFYVLIPLPILAVSIYFVSNIINKKAEIIQTQLSKLTNVTQETYSGIRIVKSFVQQLPMTKYFQNESEDYKNKSLKLA